ncbi:MAG: trigger factor [bacterium]
MQFETKQTDKSTYQITATVPFAKLEEAKGHVLTHFKENAEIKGFRKGMAPMAEVEKAVDKGKLYGEIVNHLVPEAYSQAIKETHLKPIISPRIQIKQFDYDTKKDLILEITTCVKPEIKLPDYKNLKLPTKIIKPSDPSEPSLPSPEEKQAQALQALLEKSEVTVPQLLVDEEVDRAMASLVDRTAQLGLTPEQYLKSVGKTAEQLRAEYGQKANQSIKQELVLSEIAQIETIKASDKEVADMIKAAGDAKVQGELADPKHRPYIENVIIKRKVLELIAK